MSATLTPVAFRRLCETRLTAAADGQVAFSWESSALAERGAHGNTKDTKKEKEEKGFFRPRSGPSYLKAPSARGLGARNADLLRFFSSFVSFVFKRRCRMAVPRRQNR
jgi:hypothetical protein